jgi:hypothetical protein
MECSATNEGLWTDFMIFFGETNHGPNSLRCTKILSQHHPFLSFLPSPFLPCKDTFVDHYDGI